HDTLPQQYVPSNAQQLDSTLFIPPDFDGPIPGYMPIQEVRRRDRRFILIGLGLLVVIALAVASFFYFNRSTPEKTLDTFCNALQNKDYPTAYAQLTSGIKRLHAEAQFETDFAGLTCSYSNISSSGSTTSATMMFKSSSGQTISAKVALIQDGDSNNNWKINSIQ